MAHNISAEDWVSVDSSMIEAVAYKDGAVFTRFKNAVVWKYAGVPEDLYDSLVDADSVGKFFNKHIKNSFAASQELD